MKRNSDTAEVPYCDWLQRESYGNKECVFRAGEQGDSVFIVESGEVEVLMGDSIQSPRLSLLGPGDLFGEVAALDRLPRSNTIRTTCPTTLIRIDFPYLNDLLGQSDRVVQYVLYTLLARIRKLSDYSGNRQPPVEALRLDSDGPLHQGMLQTLRVIGDLHHAIRVNDLDLYYRPLVCLNSNQVAGFEASLQWQADTPMRVSPEEFIQIAERSGLIHQLGTWMLHRATADWQALRPGCVGQSLHGIERPPFVSLNFSAPELARLGINEILQWCLAEKQIPANELSLELSERLMPVREHHSHPGFALADTMQQVRNLGINLALDHIGPQGTGLGVLQEFPFSSIKIDRSFVQKMHSCHKSRAIVAAMLSLARALEMFATAEGVSDAATHQRLQEMGCDYAQGDYYAPAMRRDDAVNWLQQR